MRNIRDIVKDIYNQIYRKIVEFVSNFRNKQKIEKYYTNDDGIDNTLFLPSEVIKGELVLEANKDEPKKAKANESKKAQMAVLKKKLNLKNG